MMERIIHTLLGHISEPRWAEIAQRAQIEYLEPDRLLAQRSRFVARSSTGEEYRIALKQRHPLADGDVLHFDPARGRLLVVRIPQQEVLVITPEGPWRSWEEALERGFELGHAIGNQHWPAVVHEGKILIPLALDRKVMESVLKSHPMEGFRYEFQKDNQLIPHLSPHELRHLHGPHEHHHHG